MALFFSSILVVALLFIFGGRKFFQIYRFPITALVVLIFALTLIFSIPNPLNLKKRNVVERGISVLNLASSASQRLLIWQVALELIREKPVFGWGVGTFGVHYPLAQGKFLSREENKGYIPQANRSIHAHNDYLEIWVETGIVGLLIFLWIIFSFYRRAFSFLRKNYTMQSFSSLFLIFLIGGVTSFLIHAGVSFPFHIVQNGMVFWLLMALSGKIIQGELNPPSIHCSNKPGRCRSRIYPPRFIIRWAIPVLVVASAFYLASWRVRIFTSDLQVKQAELLMEAGFYPQAKEKLSQAIRINPHNAQAFAYLTRVYGYLGLYQEVVESSQKAEKGWNIANIHNHKAFACLNLGKTDEARKALERCIFLYPNFAAGYINLGYLNLLEAEENLKDK